MNAELLELALKKQRLQFQSDRLRGQWKSHAKGLVPVLGVVDQAWAGLMWLRRHPEVVIGVGVAAAVARPRVLWRWARRAFFVWQFLRRARESYAERSEQLR